MTGTFNWAIRRRSEKPSTLAGALGCLMGLIVRAAQAQDRGTLTPKPLPPLPNPESPSTAAKELLGRKTEPSPLAARVIGGFARGCMAGGVALPVDGARAMRLSQTATGGIRHFLLERVARKAPEINGWPGLLVGDISQPRGGPMLTGHASHQFGLDADVWLPPIRTGVSLARSGR